MKNLPSYFYQTHKLQTNFIVYALLEPNTLEIRYVGKSCSGLSRVRQHFNPSQLNSKNKKSNWLKSLLNKNLYPQVKILDYANNKITLSELEIFHIKKHKSERLLNMTDGGDGHGYKRKQKVRAWNKGLKASNEAKTSMRNARLGRKFTPRSNEDKLKISKSNVVSHRRECKPFICLETGKLYNSQREAAIDLKLNPANISGVLNGHKKTTMGYSFRFI